MSSENYKRLRFFNLRPQHLVESRYPYFTLPVPTASLISTFFPSIQDIALSAGGQLHWGTSGMAQARV